MNRFASCKQKKFIVTCFFLHEERLSQPVSLNKLSIDTSFDAPVTLLAVSFCIYSNSVISHCAHLPHTTSAYYSRGPMNDIYYLQCISGYLKLTFLVFAYY